MNFSARTKGILVLACPIIIAQLGSIMQGWADTIMVGQYGTSELSAAGFVNNVFNLFIYFLLGISYATTPVAGACYSQGNHLKVLQTLRNSNVVNLFASLLVVGLLFVLYLHIDKLGQPEELLPLMKPYFLVLLASLPFLALYNSMKQFSDALGDTQTPMWVMIGSNVLNLLLNYLFIFMLDMGLVGAGVATLIARALMPVCMYVALLKGRLLNTPAFLEAKILLEANAQLDSKPHLGRFSFRGQGVFSLFCLGIPISIQLCLEAGSFNVCAIFMGWIGSSALAAHQVMCTVSTLGFMVYYGIGAAAAIRIAHYRGRNDWREVYKTAQAAFLMSLGAGVVITASICLAGVPIASIFTTSDQVAALFLSFLPCFACYQLGDCLQTVYANALRAIEDVKSMMLYAFVAYCLISIPLAYVFAFPVGLGAVGIWWSFPFGLTAAGMSFFFQFRKNVSRRLQAQNDPLGLS